MSLYLFVAILGASLLLIVSIIAGLKDNVFAAQIALAVGIVFDFFALAILLFTLIELLGGIK